MMVYINISMRKNTEDIPGRKTMKTWLALSLTFFLDVVVLKLCARALHAIINYMKLFDRFLNKTIYTFYRKIIPILNSWTVKRLPGNINIFRY